MAALVVLPAAALGAPWRSYHSDLAANQQRQQHQVDLGSLVRQGDRVSGQARIRRGEGFSTLPIRSYSFTVGCRAGTLQEKLIPGAFIYRRRGGEWWSEPELRRGSRGGEASGEEASRLRAMDAQFTALWSFVCQPR